MVAMELGEAFHLLGAESRNASLAAQQFGELGRELGRRPNLPALGRVVIDAPLGFFLLLLLVQFTDAAGLAVLGALVVPSVLTRAEDTRVNVRESPLLLHRGRRTGCRHHNS